MRCPICEGNTHPDPTGRAAFYCSRAGCGWAGAEPLPDVGDIVNYFEFQWLPPPPTDLTAPAPSVPAAVIRAAMVTAQRGSNLDLHVFHPPRFNLMVSAGKDSGVEYIENVAEGATAGCWMRRR